MRMVLLDHVSSIAHWAPVGRRPATYQPRVPAGLSEVCIWPEKVEIGFHEFPMCPQNGGGRQAQVGGNYENSNCVRATAQRSEYSGSSYREDQVDGEDPQDEK
jgi:hypothetical protein